MEELYRSILEGRMGLRLPLDVGQRTIALGRLLVMPVKQHMQFQVSILLLTHLDWSRFHIFRQDDLPAEFYKVLHTGCHDVTTFLMACLSEPSSPRETVEA